MSKKDNLIDNSTRYAKLLDLIPEIIFETDLNGLITYTNTKICNLTKKSKNIFEIFNEGQKLKQIYEGLIPKFSLQVSSNLDSNKWYLIRAKISNTGVIGVIVDITKEKALEKKSLINERFLKNTEKLANLGSWEYDMETEIFTVSDEFCKIYGVKPGCFKPHAEEILKYVHPDDRDMMRETIQNSFVTGNDYDVSKRIVRPDGEIRYTISKGSMIHENGVITKMIGYIFDITELEIAKTELNKSRLQEDVDRKKFEKLIYTVPDPIVEIDIDDNISYVNHKFLDIIQAGCIKDCLNEKIYNHFINEKEYFKLKRLILNKKEVRNYEVKLIDKETIVSINGTFINGQNNKIIISMRNITDQRKFEAIIELNKSIGTLIKSNDILGEQLKIK